MDRIVLKDQAAVNDTKYLTRYNCDMKSTLAGWLIFVACVLLLGLSATPYAHFADHILIAVRLGLILVISVVVVAEKFHAAGPAEPLLNRLRRWYRGEPQGTK